jgi:hypothetical protein
MENFIKLIAEILPTSLMLGVTFWMAKRYYEKNIEEAIKEAGDAAHAAHKAVIASETRMQSWGGKLMEMQTALSSHFITLGTRVEKVEHKIDIIGTQIQSQKLSLKRKKQNAGH